MKMLKVGLFILKKEKKEKMKIDISMFSDFAIMCKIFSA